MILVGRPGSVINGIQDMIKNPTMTWGLRGLAMDFDSLSRLAVGLFVAPLVTGAEDSLE